RLLGFSLCVCVCTHLSVIIHIFLPERSVEEGEAQAQQEAGGSMSDDFVEGRNLCPPGWSMYGNRCFNFFNSPRPWIQAEHFCLQSGANLASVHSLDEYKFMQDLVLARTGEYTRTWIGGSDAIQNNVWMWSDGSRFDFQGWGWGEPNNHQGRESCVEINYGGDKRWNDWACEDQFPFVCVKKLNC
uniref:C-type lectin domain-containing protein n=1 Tax=Myripristis murdjan TaxID=586833 RepID=A0A667YBM5_9TELE